MATYPSSIRTFATHAVGDTIQPSHVNDLQDEVTAIETGLLSGFAHPIYERGRSVAMGAWQSYTPVWTASTTNPVLVGSLGGTYALVGTTCHFRLFLEAQAGTTFGSGYYILTMPVPVATAALGLALFPGMLFAGGAYWQLMAQAITATTMYLYVTTGVTHNDVAGATYPAAAAGGNRIWVMGTYEIA